MHDRQNKSSNLQPVISLTDTPRERGVSVALLFPAIVVLSLICLPAFAHKVNLFAYVEGNKVLMEGYFSDGHKPMNCEVVVTDTDKKVLVKGMTNNEGKFSFDVPRITDLHIVLSAGMGHRGEYVISRNELAGITPSSTSAASTSPEYAQATSVETISENLDRSSSSPGVSELMIRKAVAEANLPLMRAMDELKESANFSNIIGGIGFIVGIVGVFFYIKARKMLAQTSTNSPVAK